MSRDMEREDLERDIFGGSQSELSSEDEDFSRPKPKKAQKSRPAQPAAREDAYESSNDSEDDYRAQNRPSQSKRPTARRRTSTEGKAVRKRKRREEPEPDLAELTPEQGPSKGCRPLSNDSDLLKLANKRRLEMQIEQALKSKKTARRSKKKNNEEVLDSFADDEVARLREAMNNAADEDQRANAEKLPAMSKLKLLPEAMETLQKASLAQSMIDNNLLEAVRRWLEPLPDSSLPALNIQREFFTVLRKMEFIDSAVLKESGLGKIILFYTKCKRVNPDISRVASDLVSAWSRPIIKRSASYRDRVIPVIADYGDDGAGAGQSQVRIEKLNAIMARARENEKNRPRKNAVLIPQRELGSYTVAPRANAGLGFGRGNASVDEDVERRRRQVDRLRQFNKRSTGAK
ncbi:hypothetical protein H0H92_015095 [Tricholoma furcatifolium]|nr:hypothetical protein H0H92_015095 [Tricholoma furcatifolium]